MRNRQLNILSEAEHAALYEIPDFDDEQRLHYLNLTTEEQALMHSRPTLVTQVHCALQIAYFKAKHLFFRFDWDEVAEDVAFVLEEYFPNQIFDPIPITKHQYYGQCTLTAKHFDYKLWSTKLEPFLLEEAERIICKDVNPQFIVIELLAVLREKKIMRPGYSTLQVIVSKALNTERKRLEDLLQQFLSEADKSLLQNLLSEEKTLSGLAELKRDTKDFKARMINNEREKLLKIRPLYLCAKTLLPKLSLSHENILYYANFVHYYTIYELRKKIRPEQAYLYLLCYIWQRYRQMNDNLADAFCFQIKKLEDEIKIHAKEAYSQYLIEQQAEWLVIRQLAGFFVNDEVPDDIHFGEVRSEAFNTVISKEKLKQQVSSQPQLTEMDFKWKAVDKLFHRFRLQLRPLAMALDFSSSALNNPWFHAINWLKKELALGPIKNCSLHRCPPNTIPKRLQSYLTKTNATNEKLLHANRYECWLYRQLKKRLKTGALHLDDSTSHRSFQQELQEAIAKGALAEPPDIPALNKPISQLLDEHLAELRSQWEKFNTAFTAGKLKHLHFDQKTQTLHLKKTREEQDEKLQHQFYEQLPLCDLADVLRFVNGKSQCSSAFTHIQPRYSKNSVDINCLNATIMAQALNTGNFNMAEISDIPYDLLLDTYQARLRLQTLKKANDLISNDVVNMPIFPFYSLDMAILYGGLDGQKYEVKTPTLKARNSKKYFKKGKGVVAYTMLANHIPLQVELIGAHEHESYFVFDIWYNNTSSIIPDILTGDMHLINKANFAIMDWFGGKVYPRFTNLQTQIKHLFCADNPELYKDWLIQPVGQIDRQLIEEEWPNIRPIIAALGFKELTQSALVRKLCTYTMENRTRKAIFEYDKLIRSIYTLKYLQDRKLQKNVHKSQNRIEAYHQLRAAIAETYGKKQLIGKTDREIEISNQCGRLIANAIIHYNSAILSKLKLRYEAEGNEEALALLKKISPVAWRHIHFQGHFIFSDSRGIDLDAIVAKLILKPTRRV